MRSNLKQINGLLTPNAAEFIVSSRFFANSEACFKALNEDLNDKVRVLKIKDVTETVTSLSETNPIHTNTKEALEAFKKEHPDFDQYLETWNPNELVRLTFTTEEFDEDSDTAPIISDDRALLFRYVMHELDDDLLVPKGKLYIENASSMLH